MTPLPRTWNVLVLACLLLSTNPLAADDQADAEDAVIQLHKSEKLYQKNQFKAVRAAFAQMFEAKHAATIQRAFGDDFEALSKWLNAHPALKQNFYTAFDERYDKLDSALAQFQSIWAKFPEQLAKNPDLGIAVAITWDDPRTLYDYSQHQRRTKSKMPKDLLDGLANFQYIIENEKVTEGRVRHMPWEFLVFVIDHKTPLEERAWAKKYYQTHRASKSWHQDVPYDHDMLKGELDKSSGLKPKIADRDYTLSNLKLYGGVCAQQADFAARVAKCVGVPAVYCWGASSYRGLHAWWMYVRIQKASPEQLQFTLNSDGRTVGFIKDALYTGHVTDPHTGQQMLDRDMERRLNLAGRDRVGKRHVEMLMRAYPWLAAKLSWDVKQRVAFLDKCLKICPQSDEPWQEFGRLVKAGELPAEEKGVIRQHVSSVLTQFKNYPDFIERVYLDLLPVFEPAEQVRMYQQAVTRFEQAGRADLSCAARLRITDALAEQKKWPDAGRGLMATIKRFPTEGRYVPKMTLRMQEVAGHYKGGNEQLAKLYIDLVPKLMAYYRKDDQTFSQQLYKQALDFFEKNQMAKYTKELRARTGK
jgi:hypothetical protein